MAKSEAPELSTEAHAANAAGEAAPLYTVEPATPEESRRAEKRIREYHKDPSSFVPFKKRVTG
jgi:hypothetical protein